MRAGRLHGTGDITRLDRARDPVRRLADAAVPFGQCREALLGRVPPTMHVHPPALAAPHRPHRLPGLLFDQVLAREAQEEPRRSDCDRIFTESGSPAGWAWRLHDEWYTHWEGMAVHKKPDGRRVPLPFRPDEPRASGVLSPFER